MEKYTKITENENAEQLYKDLETVLPGDTEIKKINAYIQTWLKEKYNFNSNESWDAASDLIMILHHIGKRGTFTSKDRKSVSKFVSKELPISVVP